MRWPSLFDVTELEANLLDGGKPVEYGVRGERGDDESIDRFAPWSDLAPGQPRCGSHGDLFE